MTDIEKLQIERDVLHQFIQVGWRIVLDAEKEGHRAQEGYDLLFAMLRRMHEVDELLGVKK